MSIYRRYVSERTLRRFDDGMEIAQGQDLCVHANLDHTHPIYIVVPDEDAPEPPEIDFEREYRDASGTPCRIVSPPAWAPGAGGHWWVMVRWPSGGAASYPLQDLTPIEPAPERMVPLSAVREALEAEARDSTTAEFVAAWNRAVLARLEGSDG